ncbi:MAG TPA: mechanosensitive ion channel domain-containing protein [Steroidobacteraceae bacterium]|jgi:small-conductance mechanosensitive channel|nr:mechanosensitive ion channel domain-containing protein [Steroidobacteraceae bacterium]
MHDITLWQHQLLSVLEPSTPIGAFVYFVLFVVFGLLLSRGLRAAVNAALSKERHIDRTAISFMQQIGTVVIWIMVIILYAHLIPQLRSLGTALLAGAGVASVVIGLAAQSTLGNLVAGISMTIYRPFRLGDVLQVAAPTGTEIGIVDHISLGYTTLRVQDGRSVVLPNSVAASQVSINLNPNTGRWPLSIAIRVNRDDDLEAVSSLARKAAAEVVDEAAITGCYLTRVDATEAQLELRFQAPDGGSRDSLRAAVMMRLNQRLTASASAPGAAVQRPTFA